MWPERLAIEPTNDCGRSCTICPRHNMKGEIGYMEMEDYKKIVKEATGMVDLILIGWRGECTLHPNFPGMVAFAKERVSRVEVLTGAPTVSPLVAEALMEADFLSISVHGPEQEGWIKRLAKLVRRPEIQLTAIETEETVGLVQSLASCVDSVKIKEVHSLDGVPGKSKTRREQPSYRVCPRLSRDMLVAWNGKVSNCTIVWEPDLDINAHSLGIRESYRRLLLGSDEWWKKYCQTCDQFGERTKEATE